MTMEIPRYKGLSVKKEPTRKHPPWRNRLKPNGERHWKCECYEAPTPEPREEVFLGNYPAGKIELFRMGRANWELGACRTNTSGRLGGGYKEEEEKEKRYGQRS